MWQKAFTKKETCSSFSDHFLKSKIQLNESCKTTGRHLHDISGNTIPCSIEEGLCLGEHRPTVIDVMFYTFLTL